jgi:hypothetical protein
MVDDRALSGAGVSLLSLYGDDNRMVRKIHGDHLPYIEGYDERIGAFLPGLMKVVKKVGKVTSGVTTGIARTVGVPQSALNALAHLDPTKKGGASAQQAITSLTTAPKTIEPVPFSVMGMDKKKLLIVGGSAVGALVLLKLLMSPRPK